MTYIHRGRDGGRPVGRPFPAAWPRRPGSSQGIAGEIFPFEVMRRYYLRQTEIFEKWKWLIDIGFKNEEHYLNAY